MGTIVILKGACNTGKSTSLNLLIELLKSDSSYEVIIEKCHNEFDKYVVAKGLKSTIAIITAGDPCEKEFVTQCLDESITNGADIIFAASRTRGCVYDQCWYFANNHKWTRIDASPLISSSNEEQLLNLLNSHTALNLKSLIPLLSIN